MARRVSVHQNIETRIRRVEFEGLKRVNPEYLRTLTTVHAGDTVDTAAISRDAARLAVVDDLDGVEYKLTGDPDNPDPGLAAEGAAASGRIICGRAWDCTAPAAAICSSSWAWSTCADGSIPTAQSGATGCSSAPIRSSQTSLYQPLNVAQTFFVEPLLLARQSVEDVYNDGDRVARYHFNDAGGRARLRRQFGRTTDRSGSAIGCSRPPGESGHRDSPIAGG